MFLRKKGVKYNNTKIYAHNRYFDSKKEAKRATELILLEKSGKIKNLKFQVKYLLIDKFVDKMGNKHRKIEYVADFEYIKNNTIIVEDSKGFKTEVYKIKKKLLLSKYKDIIFIES